VRQRRHMRHNSILRAQTGKLVLRQSAITPVSKKHTLSGYEDEKFLKNAISAGGPAAEYLCPGQAGGILWPAWRPGC
jgi:hypothetical protein